MTWRVVVVGKLTLEDLGATDRQVIEDDWRKIQSYVRQGRAHELSEGSTMYLAACVKGAGGSSNLRRQPRNPVPARQRAYSLKPSFLTRAIEGLIRSERARQDEAALVATAEQLAGKSLEEVALERLHRYRGWTVVDIWRELDPSLNLDAKGIYAHLARRMLGVRTRKIEEFEKAGVTMKIVRLQRNGKPKEAMSFPAFKFKDLAHQTWRRSDLRDQFGRRFLFVFFREVAGELKFERASFWSMPPEDLDGEVRRVWVETVCRIRNSRAHDLPGISFSPIAHVRPHGRNARDVDEAPDGKWLTKKCFWLNAAYLAKIYASSASDERP